MAIDRLLTHSDPAYQRWLAAIADDITVGDGSILLYGRESLPERNATYEVAEWLPTHLLIGDDGGGRGFLLKCDGTAGPVFRVGLGSLDESDFEIVAPGFTAWRAAGFPPGS